MGPVYAMVYLSGFLNDVYEMVGRDYDQDAVLLHLRDASEMLSYLTRD